MSAPLTTVGLRSSLAANLRRQRAERGFSLRELANQADLSKALLSRIERGDGNPSVETLFRLAHALGCAISDLITVDAAALQVVRSGQGRVIASDDDRIVSRLLFASGGQRRLEIFEVTMEPGARSDWAGRPGHGVTEYALVQQGRVAIEAGGAAEVLGPGDAISFDHDARNAYQAQDEPVRLLCVVAYGS